MPNLRPNRAETLLALLKEENQSIRSGNFERIAALNTAKQKLEKDLSNKTLSSNAAEFTAIGAMARENLRLIEAAKQGIQGARTRLEALRRISLGAGTYQANGHRHQWSPKAPEKDIFF